MKTTLILTLVCVFGLGCALVPPRASAPADPYSVYSDLLAEEFFSEDVTQLVVNATSRGLGRIDTNSFDMAALLRGLRGVKRETIVNYLVENESDSTIESNFRKQPNIVLIRDEDHADIFSNKHGAGWEEFYRRYPASQGITDLSRVGFSKDHTQAVLYIGTQSHWRSGIGKIVLMKWNGRRWKKVREEIVWLS